MRLVGQGRQSGSNLPKARRTYVVVVSTRQQAWHDLASCWETSSAAPKMSAMVLPAVSWVTSAQLPVAYPPVRG